MKRKTLISVVVTIIMLLNCLAPLARVYAAETSSNTITLNSELYTAVSEYMKNNNIKGFTYNDLLRTITASSSSFSSVKELSLKEKGIDDLTGLEVFTGLESLDLSGNYLTLDSNVEVINGFSALKSLDLSTNRIDGFAWLDADRLDYKNLNRQDITTVKLIDIPSYDSVTDPEQLPDQIDTLTGMLSELNFESVDVDISTYKTDGKQWDTTTGRVIKDFETKTEVGTETIDYEENKFSFAWRDIYDTKDAGNMYYINARVVNSTHKYYDSNIDLYYIFVDETERGIIFKDENFYKCVKEQLTKNSETNPSNLDEDNNGKLDRNLYNAAYDKALTLVISIDDLRNHIKSLICQNEKIKDLTGLEKFIGLETEFNVSFNYVDSIEKVIELERNKAEEERKIREEIKELINKITNYTSGLTGETSINYREMLKAYMDKQKEYDDKLAAISNSTAEITEEQQTALTNLGNELDKARNDAKKAITNLNKILEQLEKIYYPSYNMATIQTAGLYDLLITEDATQPYKDSISELSKDEALEKLTAELLKLQTFEKDEILSEAETKIMADGLAAIFGFNFTASTEATGGSNQGGPISQFITFCGTDIRENATKDQLKEALVYIKNADITVANTTDAIFEGIQINETQQNGIGDINGDGNVDGADVELLQQSVTGGTTLTAEQEARADINQDGNINVMDVIALNQIINNRTSLYSSVEAMYRLTGRLVSNNTDEMLNVVAQLPRLKDLDISVNNIESLATIDELTKLLSLNASDNLLTTIEDVNWSAIEWLEYLNLGYNQLQTYEGLRGTLPNLKGLGLNNCLFSGEFDFDFISYFDKLQSISFAGNYYSDLTSFVNKYIGKLKKTNYDSLADYIKYGKGIAFSFANQTVNLDAGNVTEANGAITIQLPPIFKNIEDMDPYHTTYGVVPGTGTVDEYGRTVMYSNYNTGKNTGVVTIETVLTNINNNESNIYSVGNGTTCYINYTVGSGSSGNTDNTNTNNGDTNTGNTNNGNTNTDDNNTTDNNDNDNNNKDEEGTKTVTSEDLLKYENGSDNYLLVAQPSATNASLAKALTDSGLTVKSINGSENYTNDKKKVFTSEVVVLDESGTEKAYDVVVLGDVDGDGDVDSIDSGYSRALKYGTLYADIEDEAERTRLMNAFKNTSNFRAADLNQDGSVRTNETAQLLYYRAGLINNFDAELANLAQ